MSVGKLSGGAKRKLSLAVAIAGKTDLVILDEPTSAMDVETRMELKHIILELKKDHCIVLSTQHFEEAEELADTIGFMDKGKLMSIGSVEFVKKVFGFG